MQSKVSGEHKVGRLRTGGDLSPGIGRRGILIPWRDTEVAKHYLERFHHAIPYLNDQTQVALDVLAHDRLEVRRFLDLGCGDGRLTDDILKTYPDANAVLVDCSRHMLEQAAQRLASKQSQVSCVLQDYSDEGWTASYCDMAPFDLVVSSYSIHHQPDRAKYVLYQDIFRLLRPGGWFMHIEHVAARSPWGQELWDDLMIDRLYTAAQAAHEETSKAAIREQYLARPDRQENRLTDVNAQCQWLRKIGFAEVDCFFKYLQLAVFGGRRPMEPTK